MSRKQFGPQGSSHEKKLTRKERKKLAKENPIGSNQDSQFISAPTEEDKKQLNNLTIFAVVFLVLLLILMYYIFVS